MSSKRSPRRCDCGKIKYPTLMAAIAAALRTSRRLGKGFRTYEAHGFWHITSWTGFAT